ncbi:hypothetical protein [Thermoleptolyngbya sp.]
MADKLLLLLREGELEPPDVSPSPSERRERGLREVSAIEKSPVVGLLD